MNKLLPVSFFLLVPSMAFAHGGPELFIFLWSIELLPVFIATAIAPRGYRLAWLISGIVITVSSVFILGSFFIKDEIYLFLVVPALLVPAAIFHRIRRGKAS